MHRPTTVFAITLLCLAVLALVFYPATAPGQSGGGGGGQGGGGGEETTATNPSYPVSFYGSSLLTGTIGSYSLGGTLDNGMSYACAIPEKIGTTTYPNTSCVTPSQDGTTFTADSLSGCQAKCPNTPVERVYWQKNQNNAWLGGYGVPLSADQTTPATLPAEYIDWGDNLEGKSWPVQTIRVELNTFSTLAVPTEGAPNTRLRFDMWHVFGQGTNELWGARTTDANPPTPYTYSAWPYAVNVAGDARLSITKLALGAATCPTAPTGATQSPFQGDNNLTWVVDNPATGTGQWSGAAYTSPLVNKITPELNIKGSYVYGYNWNLGTEPVPQNARNTGWWRLTFYSGDKSIDFTNWLAPDVAGVNTLAPPTSDLQPSAGSEATQMASQLVTAAAEGGETGMLYVPQVDKTNQLTYIDVCITGGIPPAETSTTLTYSPASLVFGSSTTLTATVTSSAGTPTGTVSFLEGTNVLGTGTLDSNGTATYVATNLSAGSHTYTASYAGTADFAASKSSELAVTVDRAPTTAAISASANPGYSGEELTFTATITSLAGTPTGDVTFSDGSTTLGTGVLDGSGITTYATSALSIGNHSIKVAYAGDTSFASSNSEALDMTINAASFAFAASNSQATVQAGQSAIYNFTITPKGNLTDPISFTCSGLPAHSGCSFAPPTVTLGTSPAEETLTISTTSRIKAGEIGRFSLPSRPKWLLFAALAFLASLALFVTRKRHEPGRCEPWRFAWAGTLALAIGLVLGGCGGGSSTQEIGTPAGTYSVAVTGTSGSQTVSSQVSLNVQ